MPSVPFILECAKSVAKSRHMVNRIENIQWANEYAEPGYTIAEGKCILFADWNNETKWDADKRESILVDDTMSRLADLLEKLGHEIEWEDEWCTCGSCNKALRTQPDSMGWTPSFVILNECGLLCEECLKDDVAPYFDELDNAADYVDCILDATDYGYCQIADVSGSSLRTDMHAKAIAEMLQRANVKRYILEHGSYAYDVKVFVHFSQSDKARKAIASSTIAEAGLKPETFEKECEEFYRAYVECALWSSTYTDENEDDMNFDKTHSADDIAAELVESMRDDCVAYMLENYDDLETCGSGPYPSKRDCSAFSTGGHVFWLSRNGHGVTFNDGDYPEDVAKRLEGNLTHLRSVDLYIGDDGKIYGM